MGMNGAGRNDINVTPLIDVLLVLLVIFLVATPLMMKMESIEVPQNLDPSRYTADPRWVTLKIKADQSITLDDGDQIVPIAPADVTKALRPKLAAMSDNKVVFVDFEDAVPWVDVVAAMDTIRGLAADAAHDEIKVALKIRSP
jgi:biopolymer transport protein ExbD